MHHDTPADVIADPLRRLRWLLLSFITACIAILVRAATLEATSGEAFRSSIHQNVAVVESLPATRGRLMAHDGSVLACDEAQLDLALNYRYLEDPPDPAWLRGLARERVRHATAGGAANRRDPARRAAELDRLRVEINDLHRRLARLCGLSPDEWQSRCRRIQQRVESASAGVNRRRDAAYIRRLTAADDAEQETGESGWTAALHHVLDEAFAPPREQPPRSIDARDEWQEHVLARGLSLAAVAQIEGNPGFYPGTKILRQFRRAYPQQGLAAHVIGYVSSPAPNETEGRSGVEKCAEPWLRGTSGRIARRYDSRGRLVASNVAAQPIAGRDVILSIDTALQRVAEGALDEFQKARPAVQKGAAAPSPGGAIVVLDVRTGAVLSAAAAPRFNPGVFVGDQTAELKALLADRNSPLLDRTAQMAIPPGSVFKTATAIALLEAGALDPAAKFECRGYLRQPTAQRCEIYRRYGVGHGPLTLYDALAQSCNVYFYHHAAELGPEPLVAWAAALGFGQPTGCDWCRESAGQLPTPDAARAHGIPWRAFDTESLAIGQGRLTATPLQIVRLMAAVANGGRLVTPHVLTEVGLPTHWGSPAESAEPTPHPGDFEPLPAHPAHSVPGLTAETLEHVRRGLKRVVADPNGTGYTTVRLAGVAIAGKTGTAETGGGQSDHAWFAGYAPADDPQVAFVVALEHAGSGGSSAGPLAKRLIEHLARAGYFRR